MPEPVLSWTAAALNPGLTLAEVWGRSTPAGFESGTRPVPGEVPCLSDWRLELTVKPTSLCCPGDGRQPLPCSAAALPHWAPDFGCHFCRGRPASPRIQDEISPQLYHYRCSSLRRRSRSDRESRLSDLAARYWCFQTPKRVQRSGGDLYVRGGGVVGAVA